MPGAQPPRDTVTDNSLTLKDYLETATDASRRTRFITIIMVVASVLLLVSVLNSAPFGWITLRLNALGDPTSKYTLEKFPLLCRCDPEVQADTELTKYCAEKLGREDDDKGDSAKEDKLKKMYWPIDRLDIEQIPLEIELAYWKSRASQIPTTPSGASGVPSAADTSQIGDKIKAAEKALKATLDERQKVCDEEKKRLGILHDALLGSAAETKYTVRVPFFGVALDINDVGILGGLSLSIILIMLRLSLRNQIVSLRIGFKAARASKQERRFYEILAARQVFVFPFLEDKGQRGRVAMGWTEAMWQMYPPGRLYRFAREWLVRSLNKLKIKIDRYLNLQEEAELLEGAQRADKGEDVWRVNRNTSLRIVPKLLCLLPFLIYALQFWFDYKTQYYGDYLDEWRTRWLFRTDLFFLLTTLGLGLWCVTKWNELDKLWDYFKSRIKWED